MSDVEFVVINDENALTNEGVLAEMNGRSNLEENCIATEFQ